MSGWDAHGRVVESAAISNGADAWHAQHGDLYKGAQTGRTPSGTAVRFVNCAVRIPRRDLRESLEAYAARLGVDVHVARPSWRAEGLRLLNVADAGGVVRLDVDVTLLPDYHSGLCAIAPGVAVPTTFVDWPDQ